MEYKNEEYEFMQFGKSYKNQKLADGYAYVYRSEKRKSVTYNVTFPTCIRDAIIEKGLTSLSIAQSKFTGDLLFIFQKDTGSLKIHDKKTNCYISCKELVDFLFSKYNQKIEYGRSSSFKLKLSDNLANKDDILTYRALKAEER